MADATGYVVNATATSGHTVSCSSATATCILTDLLCSETYVTTITAQGSQCDSAPSPSTNITTCECEHECEKTLGSLGICLKKILPYFIL